MNVDDVVDDELMTLMIIIILQNSEREWMTGKAFFEELQRPRRSSKILLPLLRATRRFNCGHHYFTDASNSSSTLASPASSDNSIVERILRQLIVCIKLID